MRDKNLLVYHGAGCPPYFPFLSQNVTNTQEKSEEQEIQEYQESVTVERKPSLWQRFKQSKFVRTIKYIMKIRIVLEVPALPSADEQSR